MTNLPSSTNTDSATQVKTFFDRYYIKEITFPADQIDVLVGFFQQRGFNDVASNTISTALLQQAKLDNVNVIDLIDTLSGLDDVKLSALVTEILNYNRQKTSVLGFRTTQTSNYLDTRNIII